MKSIKIKETYLLILIVLGLFSIAIYSTFALFSASSEINDVVSLNATLSTGSSVLEYEMIKVPAGEYKIIELNINNTYTSSLYYGAWYEVLYPENSSDVSVGLYTEENSNSSSGQLTSNGSITLLVGISNNTNEEAIVNIGTVGSLTSNLGIESPRQLLESGWNISTSPSYITVSRLGGVINTSLPSVFTTSSNNDSYEDGLYAVQDDLGTSYVFRGNVTNNYVKFGKYTENVYHIIKEDSDGNYIHSYGTSCPSSYVSCTQVVDLEENTEKDMYWRIVRINGDGSIRLIYDGTEAYSNSTTEKDSFVGRGPYNNLYDTLTNTHVGYMYGSNILNSHENTNDSDLKKSLDAWYAKYFSGTSYSSYISDAIYCNDRTKNSTSITWGSATFTGGGSGIVNTIYGISARSDLNLDDLYVHNSLSPMLTCTNTNDRFAVGNSVGTVVANGALTYPVGTITVDELIYAGSYDDSSANANTYLYADNAGDDWFLTMSPFVYYGQQPIIWLLINGNLGYFPLHNFFYIRPSITLKSDTLWTGNGTVSNPFTLTGIDNIPTYNISLPSSNTTLANTTTTASYGSSYTNTLTINSSCDTTVTVTMGGNDITDRAVTYSSSSSTITPITPGTTADLNVNIGDIGEIATNNVANISVPFVIGNISISVTLGGDCV